ncbi:hypothetical protein BH24ACT5_BH24ACT5_20040 [soil metagenome]
MSGVDTPTEADVESGPESDTRSDDTVTLYGCLRSDSRGQTVVHPTAETYLEKVKAMLDDGYTMCVDLTAVDYLHHEDRSVPDGVEAGRFEVVVNLLDMRAVRRVRIRVQLPSTEPSLPTLFDLHPGTEAMEREVFDMFGIAFDGHPDLTRILMPEDWEGYPLRKDYAVGEIPVQFKGVGEQ